MKREQDNFHRDMVNILRQPQGIRVMRRLLQLTGVWSASYTGNDALAMAYNEGRRSVGVYILQMVQAQAPETIEALLGWNEAKPQVRTENGDHD